MMGDLTFLANNVRGMQSSKKRIRFIETSKVTKVIMEFFFYKKHIPVLRMKMHGLMVLVFRYYFLTVRLTLAMF